MDWCGLPVSHIWRCGNRGNVASVLLEKPARGDFHVLVDGGFSLQYSPLLEYREGRGLVLFCQLDVTGRSEPEPAAETLVRNLLSYDAAWKPTPRLHGALCRRRGRKSASRIHRRHGASLRGAANSGLIKCWWPVPARDRRSAAHAVEDPRRLAEVRRKPPRRRARPARPSTLLPGGKVRVKNAEHIASYFEPPALNSAFAGIQPRRSP